MLQIGLMRNGKILAEGKPQTLLETYNCTSIENVFVYLSRKQVEKSLFNEIKERNYAMERQQRRVNKLFFF